MIKRKFLLTTICTLIFIIILTLGCTQNNDINNEQNQDSPILLTIKYDDFQNTYTLGDLESMESYSGTGRYIKTKLLPDSVVISDTQEYTGVRISTLIEQIPNLPDNYNVSAISNDGWIETFTIDEIFGSVDVYNEAGEIISNETAVMIIAYKEDGSYYSEIDPENEIGPLRIAFVGDDIITSSNLWSKMVITVDIIAI